MHVSQLFSVVKNHFANFLYSNKNIYCNVSSYFHHLGVKIEGHSPGDPNSKIIIVGSVSICIT